ncbi:hypothetical protein Cgig2_017305 [Carnegiea gigantea]|uniref:Transmembrane protein n=1 Tax=Carnegiea gigantea TaxID=171969 RepID=A0A9Q1KHX6_9CARY|nr:hypothetical protein Cgig2_017305 [Carnegiea gigantea]
MYPLPHMGSVFPLFLVIILVLLLVFFPSSSKTEELTTLNIHSARLLDLAIRDYTVKNFDQKSLKTGVSNNVHLPSNLSGIEVEFARFRCGSLRRYGAHMQEFHLSKERYELVTPILGLLAYNGGDDDQNVSTPNPFELGIVAGENPIKVDFTNVTRVRTSKGATGNMPYCATFKGQGKVTLAKMVSPNICVATSHGHFGLVIEAIGPSNRTRYPRRLSRWKVALGSSIGAALGAFLLGLLLVAMFVNAKKRSKLEEMVRRAYEEEALQVSMVGHVRAPIAPPTRTVPIIERGYRPPFV